MTSREVILDGGSPWGFRMHGGADTNQPLRISRVNPGSKAAIRGIREGDLITSINGQLTRDITNSEAHGLLKTAGDTLRLGLNEDSNGSPKRRQYKTIHQETHSETVKRSSVTTYSIKTSKTTEGSDSQSDNSLLQTRNEHQNQNGESKNIPSNNIVISQTSTLSSNGSSVSTPSSLIAQKDINRKSPNNAEASSQYSNLTSPSTISIERGTSSSTPNTNTSPHHSSPHSEHLNDNAIMADNAILNSRSRRRRARKKAQKNNHQQTPVDTSKHCTCDTDDVEIKSTNIEVREEEETVLDYKVEFPEMVRDRKIEKSVTKQTTVITKSKSLDDDEMLKIQELSETSENEEKTNECHAIISEAESEAEWEETSNIADAETSHCPLSTLSLPIEECCMEQVTLISPEEELTLRNFLEGLNLVNSPEDAAKQTFEKSTADSIKTMKAKKRALLEQYFLPMVHNPRYLDVISEETSDFSDREPANLTHHLKQGTPELDLPESKPPIQGSRRKRQRKIHFTRPVPQADAILVGTKILDVSSVAEGVCSTSHTETALDAEVVYLNDSSNSNSPKSPNTSSDYEDCKEELKDTSSESLLSDNNEKLDITDKSETDADCGKENNEVSPNTDISSFTIAIDNEITSQLTPPPTPDSISPKTELYDLKTIDNKSFIESVVLFLSDNKLDELRAVRQDVRFALLPTDIKNQIQQVLDTDEKAVSVDSNKSDKEITINNEVAQLTNKLIPGIVYSNVISPPAPSRSPSVSSGSSSRETSLSTVKYNPNSSIADISSISRDEELLKEAKTYFQSLSLRELCLRCLMSLPFGAEMLQELADVSSSIDSFTNKLPSKVLPKLAPALPAFIYNNNLNNSKSNSSNFPVCSNTETMPEPTKDKWVGIPTEQDPKLLLCLSPTQKTQLDTSKKITDEANKLLELHEKFINRKRYHEEEVKKEIEEKVTVTTFNKSGCDVSINFNGPCNRLLAIIREEPSAQTSAASDTNKNTNDDTYLYYESKDNQSAKNSATLPRANVSNSSRNLAEDARLKARDLSEWLQLARQKSMSESNLTPAVELNNFPRRVPTNNRLQSENTTHFTRRRTSLPQELYERQLQYLLEKEREVFRELEKLEDEKRQLTSEMAPSRQFQPEDYHISRKGDYAENKTKPRPTSMPVVPSEFFRQQMYEEYMNQIAEREERRQHKVIKLSSSKQNLQEQKEPKEIIVPITHVCDIEDEFMKIVKQKQQEGKINDDVEDSASVPLEKQEDDVAPILVIDGEAVKGANVLPKHLREFMDITKNAVENIFEMDVGIWSPGQKQETRPKELPRSTQDQNKDEAIPAIWTPKSASSSPTVERKEFRPVSFQSPVLSRKHPPKENTQPNSPSSTSEPPWKAPDTSSNIGIALSSSLEKRLTTSHSSPASGFDIPSSRLPKAQNPTITLLQKAREGQLPKGARYLEQEQGQFRRTQIERPPVVGPGEILYKIRNEYTSESDSERPRKMADLGPRKIEGIGPTTKNGMPLTLRSEVKDTNQSKWYKRMYDTIHKQKPHNDEYVTVRYKQRRAQYPYTSGYLSEPEPGAYDSDYTSYKYATLDRRRQPLSEKSYDYTLSSTMPRNVPNKSSSSSDIIRNTQDVYKGPPGRIENYRPGHSSISEKEAKEWWDEVMDIFDGHLEQQKRVPQTKSFINQALKESGYESDSTLVFRRKEEAAQQLSPLEQKEAYKVIQKGGDVPLHGLRKLAPERPKDEEHIEYFPLSPTLTRIRIHKNIIPQQEIICYPVTVHHNVPNTFADFKRSAPSASIPTPPTMPPPSPPRRRSSRNNSTLRLISTMKVQTAKSPVCKRHETCFTTTSNVDKTNVKYLRDKLTCKMSPSIKRKVEKPKIKVYKTVTASPALRSRITSTLTTTKDPRTSSSKILSKTNIKPPDTCCSVRSRSAESDKITCKRCARRSELANSRISSPNRTFGQEKRKFDFSVAKPSGKQLKIAKSPDLLSPTEVKKVVLTQKSTPAVTYKKSTALLSSSKNNSNLHQQEHLSLPIKVGISEKAKNIIKPSVLRPSSASPYSSPKPLRSKRITSSQTNLSVGSNRSKSSLESLHSPVPNRKSANNTKLKVKPIKDTKKTQKSKKDQMNVDIIKRTKTAPKTKSSSLKKPKQNIVDISKEINTLEDENEFGSTSTLADIQKQKDAIQNDQFFQHLLLRDISPTPSTASKNSWLLEKTYQLQRRRSSISEPNIGAMKIYLKHTRPVSDSKFKSLDLALARSRSVSPKTVTWKNVTHEAFVHEKPSKRSSSLPAKLIFSQTSRPVSPVVEKRLKTPPLSPTVVRSPSSRRIMQLKTNQNIDNVQLLERSRNTAKKAPLSIYMCPSAAQSTSSIDSFENNEYQFYVKELLDSSRRSKRFKDLNHFYSDLEKLGQLERSFSVKPRKRSEHEIVDFDRWQEVRSRERAERELKLLHAQLKDNEKEMGFLYMPKDINRYKWKKEYDRGLRIKEKSVDNIKEEFEKLKQGESEIENAKRRALAYSKDTYKPLWRGNSVVNLANSLVERRSQSESRVPYSKPKFIDYETDKLLTHGIGSRIWSSLSMEQVNILKEQLAEIYNQNISKEKKPEEYTIQVPKDNKQNYYAPLSVRRNSDSLEHVYKTKPSVGLSTSCHTASMSESDKRLLSQSLSKEVLDRIQQRKENKIALPLVIAKEVRGAVAAADANIKFDTHKEKSPKRPLVKTDALSPNKISSTSETESGSTDESTKTVIFVNKDDIKKKVEYFEKVSEIDTYTPTVYKPAESHYDFGDTASVYSDKTNEESLGNVRKSESCQDFKEYFGEQQLQKFATIPLSASRKDVYSLPPRPQFRALSPVRNSISEATSFDSLYRSRSLSPYLDESRAFVKAGEVQRLKDKFEFLEDFYSNRSIIKPRRSRSDSDLTKGYNIFIPGYNFGYVDSLRRKYEFPAYSGRGRSRTRRGGVVSPIFLRAEDRFMPHINIISKIANLYSKKESGNEKFKSTEELAKIFGCPVGEVEKLKEKFNSLGHNISLIGHMFTSYPDIKELRDIAPYLTASWIAHRYPKSEDNTRSVSSPEQSTASRDTSLMRKDRRPKSTSPQRPSKKFSSILKTHKRHRSADYFEKQNFDPRMHQPVSRYQPLNHEPVRYRSWWTSTNSRPSVSFKEPEPPVPPPKSQHALRNLQTESPRKYVENEVTIHYKTPVRQEIKECLSEDELAYRQAEAMKKIYQEERRRKYLQELQDINSRRHTDNFIPSQKSPIPLNRYDDFEVLPPSTKPQPRSPEPRLLAKALYNFVGQTPRELTFRKGDLIYVRRQVDKNWYEGELNAMVGLFPVNYVEIIQHDGMKNTPRKSYEGQARAKYNFIAQTHLELSLAKGEHVIITRKVDDNWYEGKIGGRKGIFPVSYVEVLIDPHDPPLTPSTKPVASPAAHSLLHNGSAGGKESMGSHLYTPSLPNPQLSASYHAKPVQISGAGTYGSLNRSLKNPVSQALHIETQAEPIPYRALYKYNPQNDDELELLEGDVVFVLEKCDDGWYVGSSERTGAFGTFPGNYVEKI